MAKAKIMLQACFRFMMNVPVIAKTWIKQEDSFYLSYMPFHLILYNICGRNTK